MAPLEILIVGCSIAGPTLATCLLLSDLPASQKPHITLLERSPRVRKEGQNVDIRGAGVTIMKKLGMEKAVRARTTGEEGVQWVDDHNRICAAFAAGREGDASAPTAEIEILRGHLAEICFQRSKSVSDEVQEEGGKRIDFIFNDCLDELEQRNDQVHVHFAKSKQRQSFDLVVGADGLQSTTRALTWGQSGEQERVNHFGVYSGYFSMPRDETDTSWSWRRWYHAPGRRNIMLRPDTQGNRTTVFMYIANDKDQRLHDVALQGHRGVKAQKELLKEYFQDIGWRSEEVISAMMASEDFYYDFVGQIRMDHWHQGRVVLLGDAGYCASPFSGMGTTLAMTGAWNLAGAIFQHPGDLEAAFQQYETRQRPIVQKAQKVAPYLPRLLSPETAWGVWTLNSFMYLIWQSGLVGFLAKFLGPQADTVPIEDYGFRQPSEVNL